MPESDCNHQVSIFQLTFELLSADVRAIERLSQPCMLWYRSLPVLLSRTFLLRLPLLFGISVETQKIKIEVLRNREGYPRSEAIRFSLIPRSGAVSPPQVIEAEMEISSQLPGTKELLHNWKRTFCLEFSLHMHPATPGAWSFLRRDEEEEGPAREGEMEEMMMRWEQRRRKAIPMSESGVESSVVTTQHSDNLCTEDVGESGPDHWG